MTAPKEDKTNETKTEVLKKNGIKRPDSGTLTGSLWDIADRISAEQKRPALRKEVVDAYVAEVVGANDATANTQYARWVAYHGCAEQVRAIRGEQRKAENAGRDAEKAKREQEREDKRQAKIKAREDKDKAKAAKKAEADQKRADAAAARAKAKQEKDEAKEKAKADAKAVAEKVAAEKAQAAPVTEPAA